MALVSGSNRPSQNRFWSPPTLESRVTAPKRLRVKHGTELLEPFRWRIQDRKDGRSILFAEDEELFGISDGGAKDACSPVATCVAQAVSERERRVMRDAPSCEHGHILFFGIDAAQHERLLWRGFSC